LFQTLKGSLQTQIAYRTLSQLVNVSNPQRIATNSFVALLFCSKIFCFKPSKDRYKRRSVLEKSLRI